MTVHGYRGSYTLPCILFRLASQSCIVVHRSHGIMVALYKARAVGMEYPIHCTVEPTAESKARKNGLQPPREKLKEIQRAGNCGSSSSRDSEGS